MMNNTINGRTPEEIKKGLECCQTYPGRSCKPCPYVRLEHCLSGLNAAALAYIQQLERERDAAVEDMTELMQMGKFCRHCKHLREDGECTFDFAATKGVPWNCWQWRGVQEVE